MRDKSDELAVRNGCVFDPLKGSWAVWWIERYCKLYEGEYAGQPVILRGCHDDAIDEWRITDDFDQQLMLERCHHYCNQFEAGKDCDWQYEAVMRGYGWQRPDGDDWIRRFRAMMFWVCKKNKKTPTAAANALYLTCGDGEQGNHIYIGARDGWQVRKNLMQHCINMVEQSPELSASCKINRVECEVTHLDSRSTIGILTSSDKRTKDAKEGINGSVLLDELHVVERDLVRIVKRAGISRREPLHIEISTAGDNPDGYGQERFKLGQRIINGEVQDDTILCMIYAAPQDVTDAQIDEDPIKYGKMSNPAWGHTVHEKEFMSDYHQSRHADFDWPDFKRYRLNVWQSSVRRLIGQNQWRACGGGFTLEDLRGDWCIIGVDLSRKQDMTAAVAVFPTYEEKGLARLRQIEKFWLPEEYAEEHKDAQFLKWAREGHLMLTDGNEISVADVYAGIEEWVDMFNVRALCYDPYGAVELTQIIEQGLADKSGNVILAGMGTERRPVSQSGPHMARAIEEYEKWVRLGILEHDNNPIMDWQWGNADVKDMGNKFKIQKPQRNSVKKIDGAVASVIATAGLLELAHELTFESYYEENELEMA